MFQVNLSQVIAQYVKHLLKKTTLIGDSLLGLVITIKCDYEVLPPKSYLDTVIDTALYEDSDISDAAIKSILAEQKLNIGTYLRFIFVQDGPLLRTFFTISEEKWLGFHSEVYYLVGSTLAGEGCLSPVSHALSLTRLRLETILKKQYKQRFASDLPDDVTPVVTIDNIDLHYPIVAKTNLVDGTHYGLNRYDNDPTLFVEQDEHKSTKYAYLNRVQSGE
jgi:hypothetical protein